MHRAAEDTADIVIAGAGIVGSAVAYFLSVHPALRGQRILVIERDLAFMQASTALSAGGLRQQFSTPENIALSQATLHMIRNLEAMFGPGADVAFREQGYLLLASPEAVSILAANVALQTRAGADVALLDVPALARRFPWLSTAGLGAGAAGLSGEGWFDPSSFASLLRASAKRGGVAVLADEITGIEAGTRVEAVRLASGRRIPCGALVNAAGAWAGALAALAGVHLPVVPRKRFVYVIGAREVSAPLHAAPLTVDATGVWFRPEGRNFICGKSPDAHAEPAIGDLSQIDHDLFETQVWPALAARVPQFESIKVVGAWAGYYDTNTLDQNAIVGAHPDLANFYFANGFSGHGAQQGPAAGRAVAELIGDGRFTSIDLGRFGYARVAAHQPLPERNVI